MFEIKHTLESQDQKDHTHFWPPPPPKATLGFPEFLSTQQKPVYAINSFLIPEWPHPFLTMPIPIVFDQLLIPMNLYQRAKNQAFPLFSSRDAANLKIL